MQSYITQYLVPKFGGSESGNKLLLMDSFTAHKTDKVKDLLKSLNFDLIMIPGGCTKWLQPLDLTVNRSFKAKYKLLNASSIQQIVSTVRRTPSQLLATQYANINSATESVQPSAVLNGFRCMAQNMSSTQ